ncbi:MAG: hypothetical protein AB7N24_07800 [Dehalococcoidia bacterium]
MNQLSNEDQLRKLARLLRRYGLKSGQIAGILEDLRADIGDFERDGGSIESVFGQNLEGFAAEIARAQGRAPVPGRHLTIVLSLAMPLVAVAFVTYAWIAGGGPVLGLDYHSISFTSHQTESFADGSVRTVEVESFPAWTPLAVYSAATLAGVGMAFGLLASMLRILGDTRIGATIQRLLVTLPVGGAVGVVAAMLVGNASGYSTTPQVVAGECLVAATFIVAAVVLAREWARLMPGASSEVETRGRKIAPIEEA